jgi:hypothetical protein
MQNLLHLKRYGSIRPLVVKIRNKMKPQETRKLISITSIEQKPKPRTEFNDRRK